MSDPSNGGDFVPPGTFAMSGDILDCVTGELCYWHLVDARAALDSLQCPWCQGTQRPCEITTSLPSSLEVKNKWALWDRTLTVT